MPIELLQVVYNKLTVITEHLPEATVDQVFFHLMLDEFNNTLPRSVSEVKRVDLLNRRSSTDTYTFTLEDQKLSFKYKNGSVHIRHHFHNTYDDLIGFDACSGRLNKILIGAYDEPTNQPSTVDGSNPERHSMVSTNS